LVLLVFNIRKDVCGVFLSFLNKKWKWKSP
jgi:hypothetical protein